jgi:putative aldouronate transport system permease protein
LRNFFSGIPEELLESAKIDGASEWRVLAIIVVPLAIPSIAALSLFYAVGHWNSFFSAILYLTDSTLWPVQVWLRQLALMSSGGFVETSSVVEGGYIPPENVVYAVIVVATFPVLVIYPFVQKYFVKGSLAGAVKG